MNMELLSGHRPELLVFAAGRILLWNEIKSCCSVSLTVVHPDSADFMRGA
jgi:hypothetical protein